MFIRIYKTNVKSQKDISSIEDDLHKLFNGQALWNFDLEDCDNILRVDYLHSSQSIISLLENHGFICEELD